MKKYDHKKVEKKWQKCWESERLFSTAENATRPKLYYLIEFPYPSGDGLHVGHVRSLTALDLMARQKRLEGYDVLYPIGWDAFGLPTENFAIKNKIHPSVATAKNVARFKKQIQSLGISFDWEREINTTDPAYYKWTQWIFLKLFEHGLAYKKNMPINWCPNCKIGLANEEVVDGACERCGTPSTRKDMSQWMLKITAYADRLIDDLDTVEYLEKIKTSQINWIGRSEGAEVSFTVKDTAEKITVFTTRPDTLFGATYMVLSPEHSLVSRITTPEQVAAVRTYQEEARAKSDLERTQLSKEKTGVFTGAYAINPANNEEIPIWIADYVLASYGTGAIMAVPAHDERDFEFATKFNLPIIAVLESLGAELPYIGSGKHINSDFLNGLSNDEAIKLMGDWLSKNKVGQVTKNYKLRDWVFSRQHYWGEPIPLVYCEHCATEVTNNPENYSLGEQLNPGWVPLSENNLPLELPDVEKYEPTDTGESPLAAITDWVMTTCPRCGAPAKRETDTMPNWAGSSWYFLRYIDPRNNEALANIDKLKHWLPVDIYNGGMEHTTLHLLYSRFWNKFLFDIGVVPVSEPYKRRVSHGMILAPDGEKMSKSRGNVINPDEVVEEFGADVLRAYEMFLGPYDQAVSWDTNGIRGLKRFSDKLWQFDKFLDVEPESITRSLHKTIKKVTEDIESMRFNTAVSALMIFVNELSDVGCTRETFKTLLTLLFPVMPHLAEELAERNGGHDSLFLANWPKFDASLVIDDVVEMAVQVNGKVRDKVIVNINATEAEAKELALNSEKVSKFLDGREVKKVIFVKGKLISLVV